MNCFVKSCYPSNDQIENFIHVSNFSELSRRQEPSRLKCDAASFIDLYELGFLVSKQILKCTVNIYKICEYVLCSISLFSVPIL